MRRGLAGSTKILTAIVAWAYFFSVPDMGHPPQGRCSVALRGPSGLCQRWYEQSWDRSAFLTGALRSGPDISGGQEVIPASLGLDFISFIAGRPAERAAAVTAVIVGRRLDRQPARLQLVEQDPGVG